MASKAAVFLKTYRSEIRSLGIRVQSQWLPDLHTVLLKVVVLHPARDVF